MDNRRYVAIWAVSIALLLLLSACAAATEPTTEVEVLTAEPPGAPTAIGETEEVQKPEETRAPVVLTVGSLSAIDCWNPYGCDSFWFHGDLWADSYFGRGSQCEPVPTRLLDAWDLSEDGLTWTLKVADGITFSDGKPADAQVVAGFLEWWAGNPGLAGWYDFSRGFASVEVLDDATFRLTTKEPAPAFASVEANFVYLTPSNFRELVGDEVFAYEGFPPVGTGPYVVTEWDPATHTIYDARSEYHRGKPPIDRIIVQLFANPDAMINAYLAGDIDMTGFIPPEAYPVLRAQENTTIYQLVAPTRYELEFNVASTGKKHPAIDDLAVREAIDYAINKQQLVDVALLGLGAVCPTNWACPPNMPEQLKPDLVATPYDPEKAKQILDDAGYTDHDADGVLETPEGLPLRLRLYYEVAEAPELTIAGMVSDWLKAIGIAVDIEAIDVGMLSTLLQERDFDMLIYNMYTDVDGPQQMLYTMSCWAFQLGADGRNYSGYCNEAFDALHREAYATEMDKEAFQDALFRAEEIVNRDRPFIILAGINQMQAVRNDRFEFPPKVCHGEEGGWLSYESLMNAVVK